MTGLMNVALRRHRPQRLMMIVGLVLLLSLLLGATASAQQGPTPTYVHVYLDKEWANSQSLPPGLQNFTITGSWSAGPSGPTSTAVCQYANGALDCTYTSTLTDPNYPGGFNGIGLVVPYGLQYEISESGLPTGWQSQAGIGAFTAGFNQYCDFSYENGNSTTPDDDCLHLVVNAQTPTVAVSKTANTTYTRTYTWEIAKSVSPAVVNLFEGQQASVGYTVQVTRSAPVDSGWAVAGVISVANNSQVAVTLNSVTDAISGVGNVTVNCPVTLPASLGAGQTLVCTYTSALPNGTDRTNTATATYNTNTTATGTAPVTFGAPTTVTNAAVSVQDVYNGGAPETIGTNIAGNTTIPYTRNVVCGSNLTYVNGVATYNRLNTATIVETNQSDNAAMTVNCYRPSVGKTVDPDFTRRFTWQIVKTVTPSQIDLFDGQSSTATYTVTLTKSNPIDENFRVFGNITITNPHPTAALGVTNVTDQLGNGLNATVSCPSTTVPAGGSLVCTYTTNVPNNNDGTNTATVTTTLGTVYTSPVVPYTFIGVPPSQTTLNSVTVTDTNPATGQPWTFSNSGSQSYQLPFACVDITYDQNGLFQTTVNNTVVITQTGQQSTALVNLTCRIPQVLVSKTANTTYTRTYTWEIAKSVSPAVVNLFEGQQASVGYTVQVTRSAPVDSGWAVAGVISVANNSQVAVTLNSVTDAISGVGNVTVNCPVTLPASLGAGQTLVCTYTSALPNGTDRTNTATATYNTNTTATGTAPVTFGAPTTVTNAAVSVQDVYNGGAPETIGTNIAGNTTIPYTRNVVCGSNLTYVNGVATYNRLNTATIVETNQSDNAAMTVNCYRPSVGKTVDPDFTRRFTWQIVKTVTPSQIDLFDGQSSTATYTVTLTKSNPIDENFRVFGNITITNPHPTASLGVTSVTDRLGNGINATVTCPATTVPAGGTLVCTYTTNVPNNNDGDNTATVTTTLGTVYTSPVVPYTFIGVPPSQTTLNSVTVTDTNPATGQPWTFTNSGSQSYQLPFACVDITYNQNGLFQTTVNNTVVITQTGQQSTALVNLTCRIPQATISSVCAEGVRTWTITANYTGAYVVEFLVGGNVQSTSNVNLIANTPTNVTYSGDPTTLSGVRVTFNGNVVASESGPYLDCTQVPTASLSSVCVDDTRTWTVNVSQSGAYVAEFLVGGNVQSTTNLNLTANTPATFTYSGDPTTLSGVRVTFSGNVVASESGPYESCTPPPPPTGTLSSLCVDDTRTWTVNVDRTGQYVAEFLVGGNVQSTTNLSLIANTPLNFTYSGDPTTLSGVRVTFSGNVVASESGPYESCSPPPPPTGTLSSLCVNDTRTWTVNVSQSGAYVAEFLVGGNVQSTTNLNLTANTPATFSYNGDPTTLSGVRVTFNGNVVASESGPYESCFELPSVTLTPRCTNEGLLWQVIANRTGSYVAQVVSNGSVIEQTTLNLTANQPQDVAFTANSYTPNTVRIIYQSVQVLEQTGPEPCVDGLSAAMAPRCERVGAVWTVLVNRSGNYVAQLMSGTTVIESRNLTLTDGLDVDFQFENDSTAPRFVRLIFQGAEYARQDGLNETCVPTALPPTEEPNLPLLDKFIYLPTVVRR
jgi:hypothetical protein